MVRNQRKSINVPGRTRCRRTGGGVRWRGRHHRADGWGSSPSRCGERYDGAGPHLMQQEHRGLCAGRGYPGERLREDVRARACRVETPCLRTGVVRWTPRSRKPPLPGLLRRPGARRSQSPLEIGRFAVGFLLPDQRPCGVNFFPHIPQEHPLEKPVPEVVDDTLAKLLLPVGERVQP